MDGLLIDSEPLWREAEIAVFESVGLRLTHQLCRETTGLRIDEVVRYWHARAPWTGPSCEQVTERLLDAAQSLIIEHGSLMAGARDIIAELHGQDATLAIASSSPMRLITAVVEKFAIEDYFSVLHSAEQEIAGKPDPAVYRTTMSLLGAHPHQCTNASPSRIRYREFEQQKRLVPWSLPYRPRKMRLTQGLLSQMRF
jgi:sugar-phosphatase